MIPHLTCKLPASYDSEVEMIYSQLANYGLRFSLSYDSEAEMIFFSTKPFPIPRLQRNLETHSSQPGLVFIDRVSQPLPNQA